MSRSFTGRDTSIGKRRQHGSLGGARWRGTASRYVSVTYVINDSGDDDKLGRGCVMAR